MSGVVKGSGLFGGNEIFPSPASSSCELLSILLTGGVI